jgi:peptidyl-prolyl cis-trans isomerase D
MRDYARSLKFVLLIVIVVFILTSGVLFYFGTGPFERGPSNAVAVVNGEEIPQERFRRAQANLAAAYERMARQRLTPEIAERLGLSQQIINELVTEAVVIQGAAQEGVRVSDDELRATIQQIREFQESGRFSRDEYLKVLRQLRLDPGQFETEIRRQLIRRKMETLIKQGVKVSDAELRQAYTERHERVRAAWAYADVKPVMASVQVADADLEPLREGPPAAVQPARATQAAVRDREPRMAVAVSDAEVEAYYTEHAAEFEPAPAGGPRVLVRVPPVERQRRRERGPGQGRGRRQAREGGEDFAKLAARSPRTRRPRSRAATWASWGPASWSPLRAGRLRAQEGRDLGPGPHPVRLSRDPGDRREGGRQDAAQEVAPRSGTLGARRAAGRADPRPRRCEAALLSARSSRRSERLELEPQEATFGRGDALGEAGRDPQLDETLFGLAVGGVSTPIKTAGGFAIVKVVQHMPAGVPPVAEIRDRVLEAIKRERAEQQVTDRAKALIDTGQGRGLRVGRQDRRPAAASLFSRADRKGVGPARRARGALQTRRRRRLRGKTLERAAAAING